MISDLLHQWTYALGWTALHACWQFAIVAVICAALLFVMRRASADLRYWVAYGGLLAGAVWSIITFFYLLPTGAFANSPIIATSEFITSPGGEQITVAGMPVFSAYDWWSWLGQRVPLLGIAWIIGWLWFSLRLGFGLRQVETMRKTGLTYATSYWTGRFTALAIQAGLNPKRVAFRLSSRIQEPVTLGFIRPLVLIPVGLLTQLPPEQVEAVLLHELGHVRRYDYFFNLLQRALITCFFFHPAAHWLSRRIDSEREHACDDFAVGQSKNPHALVRALAFLSISPRQLKSGQLAMAASGQQGQVFSRLQRLVQHNSPRKTMKTHRFFPLLLLLLLTGAIFAATNHGNSKTPAEATLRQSNPAADLHQIQADCPEIIALDSLPPAALERQAERLATIERRLRVQEERLREQEERLAQREADLEAREAQLPGNTSGESSITITPEPEAVSRAQQIGQSLLAPSNGDYYADLHAGLRRMLLRDDLMALRDCVAILHISPDQLVVNDHLLSDEEARPYAALLARYRIARLPGRQIRVESQGLRIGQPGTEECSWEGETWSAG